MSAQGMKTVLLRWIFDFFVGSRSTMSALLPAVFVYCTVRLVSIDHP